MVILIDQNFFNEKKAYDDISCVAAMNNAIFEAKKYKRTVIGIDLDSTA